MSELENPLFNETEQSRDSVSPQPEITDESTELAQDNLFSEEEPIKKAPKESALELLESDEKILILDDERERLKNTPHDAYDWEGGNLQRLPYTTSEVERLTDQYDRTFKNINDQEIVDGVVESVTLNDVVLNIGFKSDGLVPRSEFRDMPELRVGDRVEVYVEQKENKDGQLILSRKKARLARAWDKIVEAYAEGHIVQGQINSKTKGGLIVDVYGLETFLPGSQIDVRPITDYDSYLGKTMEFKVVKINEIIKNAVLSHKAIIEGDMEQQRQDIIGKLEKGQVLEGTIKNITDFGAFIDLGGVDGLLYITDISWGRITHPNEVLENGQKINVVVLDYDDNKKRISLGLKQLQAHPWDVLEQSMAINSKVRGRIVNIEDYGAFLEITPGVEGLIHISEVSWSNQPINSKEYFKLGEMYEAVVVTLDRDERKMSLSIKQLTPDPWTNVKEKYQTNSRHTGIVRNITPYGVFVELEEGIGGMVHISDLSWTKRYNHPSEFVKVGDNLEIVVLDIDEEGRKMSLGHKQVEEDPWDTFENLFPIGSQHSGTVMRKDEKGAVIALPYGVEAYVPAKHLRKEDGSSVQAEEALQFVIIEFNRDDKRIIASHSDLFKKERPKTEEEGSPRKAAPKKEATSQQSAADNEKTTLGELDVLAKLKQKMEANEKKDK